jgi:hypothetical protein
MWVSALPAGAAVPSGLSSALSTLYALCNHRPELRSLFMSGYTGGLVALHGGVVPKTRSWRSRSPNARCSGRFARRCAAGLGPRNMLNQCFCRRLQNQLKIFVSSGAVETADCNDDRVKSIYSDWGFASMPPQFDSIRWIDSRDRQRTVRPR